MQATTVKLYSLGYSQTKTYLAAALFMVGNIALPQLFHLVPQGRHHMAAYLFLHLSGCLQIRLESGTPYSHTFSGHQFTPVRHASSDGIARHPIKIRSVGYGCRLRGSSLQTYFITHSLDGGTLLPSSGNTWRMGYVRSLFQRRTRFPYRVAGHGFTGDWGLFIYQTFNLQIR